MTVKNPTLFDSQQPDILWQDRKRILGMPISFTRYILDENTLISKQGLFNTVTDEILLYRILDLKLSQSLWQKIFGVGTITLYTADRSQSTMLLKNIKQPDRIRRNLGALIEKERDEKRLQGRELYGTGGYLGEGLPDYDGDGLPG